MFLAVTYSRRDGQQLKVCVLGVYYESPIDWSQCENLSLVLNSLLYVGQLLLEICRPKPLNLSFFVQCTLVILKSCPLWYPSLFWSLINYSNTDAIDSGKRLQECWPVVKKCMVIHFTRNIKELSAWLFSWKKQNKAFYSVVFSSLSYVPYPIQRKKMNELYQEFHQECTILLIWGMAIYI